MISANLFSRGNTDDHYIRIGDFYCGSREVIFPLDSNKNNPPQS